MNRPSLRVVYVPYDAIPSRWANTVQSMKMAQALSGQTGRLEVATLASWNTVFWNKKIDLKNWYGLKNDIPLVRIPAFLKTGSSVEQKWSNGLRRWFALWVAGRIPTFVFTRRIELVSILLKLGCRVLLENHDPGRIGVLPPTLLAHHKFLGVVTLSEDVAQRYRDYGLAAGKILVEPSAVDLEAFLPEQTKEEARKKLCLPLEGPLAVYSGHLYDFKGIPILCWLAEKMPHCQFVLVGGWEEDVKKWRAWAKDRGFANFRVVGHVPQSDLPPYLYAADVLLLPPLKNHPWAETTSPLKMFEYMTVRRPLVASGLKNIGAILKHRHNALLADPDRPETFKEAVEEILRDAKLASTLAERAFHDVQRNTYEERAKRILEFVGNRLGVVSSTPLPRLPTLPASFVRHVTHRLHQWKTGCKTDTWYGRLKKTEGWPPERLHPWQDEHLGEILRHARECVPYYREKIRGAWHEIPLLSKQTARERFGELQAQDRIRPFTTVQTSGSTGMPLAWRIDRLAEDVHNAVKFRNRSWWSFRLGDPHVWLWGRDEFLGAKRSLRDLWVKNKRVLNLLDLTPETVGEFYRNLKRWKPVYLYGYPSGFVELARLCNQNGYPLAELGLRGIIATAEILPQAHREFLKAAFLCPVIDEYGCAELQVIGFECPKGNMHINADTLFVEFLKEGKPVSEGEAGEIVVTDLFNKAMPLVRYQTGDWGRPRAGNCDCGRGLPLMELSVGREIEMLKFHDGRLVHPEVFTPPHENFLFQKVRRFQIIQESLRCLRVRAETEETHWGEVVRLFSDLIHREIGYGFDIVMERVAKIPRDPSGKLRYFISHVKEISAAGAKT